MRLLKLTLVLSLFVFTACSTTKNNSSTDFKLSEIKVTNATVQEMVSGIEGGHNTLKFSMIIDSPSSELIPDSLFFGALKMQLTLKNENTKQYIANAVNRSNQSVSGTEMKVDFNFDKTSKITVLVEYKVLESIYMP